MSLAVNALIKMKYDCEACGISFSTEKEAMEHNKREHEEQAQAEEGPTTG